MRTEDETLVISARRTAAEVVDICDGSPASFRPDARDELKLARAVLVLAVENERLREALVSMRVLALEERAPRPRFAQRSHRSRMRHEGW